MLNPFLEIRIFLKLSVLKKFRRSPSPKLKTNTLDELDGLQMRLDKDYYYSFEVARANLITTNRININDLKIFVGKGSYLIPNVGGKIDIFFRYINNVIVASITVGYNPSPGKYTIYVKSESHPKWKGIKVPFYVKRRNVEPIKKGFSTVNFEYANDIQYTKIPLPQRYKNQLYRIGRLGKIHGKRFFLDFGRAYDGMEQYCQ